MSCGPDAGAAQDCSALGKVCNEYSGCADCIPEQASCENGQATWCSPKGELLAFECDPVQGLTCDPDGCKGACTLGEVHDSYIGCDYYPTVTLNPVWSGFTFAIAVSNASGADTKVTITRGDAVVKEEMVGAGELKSIPLDWIPELKGGDSQCATPPPAGGTRLVANGAYRVRADRPVTVYQFSPLDYELSPRPAACPVIAECSTKSNETRCLSYTNDASLLLPASALTGSYTALSWPTQDNGSGFIAVTATEDGTELTLTGQGATVAGAGIGSTAQGTVSMKRGDVLEVVAAANGDLSGTRLRANKPIQVLGGHSCANVPTKGIDTCDHIEEVLFPEDTLGKDYLVTLGIFANQQTLWPSVVRVAAIQDGTNVSFDPPLFPAKTLNAGEIVQVEQSGANAQPVHVMGDKPILVTTYMVGQEALPEAHFVGDPSMSIAVPTEQFRQSYIFTAPTSYAINFASVIAKPGANAKIDGVVVEDSAYTPIGSSGYGVAHVELSSDTSVHTLEASQEVGLSVYGYGSFTSYMYPGGADLDRITVPPIL
ncbi:MAG: IgGFc-binding protein [Myxococcales bacterium]